MAQKLPYSQPSVMFTGTVLYWNKVKAVGAIESDKESIEKGAEEKYFLRRASFVDGVPWKALVKAPLVMFEDGGESKSGELREAVNVRLDDVEDLVETAMDKSLLQVEALVKGMRDQWGAERLRFEREMKYKRNALGKDRASFEKEIEAKREKLRLEEQECRTKLKKKVSNTHKELEDQRARVTQQSAKKVESTEKECAQLLETAADDAAKVTTAARRDANVIVAKAREEKEAWAKEKEKIAKSFVYDKEVFRIQSNSTTTCIPKDVLLTGVGKGTMFAAYLSGRHKVNMLEDGSIFVKSFPRAVPLLLEYLADADAPVIVPENRDERRYLLKAADFYQMPTSYIKHIKYQKFASTLDGPSPMQILWEICGVKAKAKLQKEHGGVLSDYDDVEPAWRKASVRDQPLQLCDITDMLVVERTEKSTKFTFDDGCRILCEKAKFVS